MEAVKLTDKEYDFDRRRNIMMKMSN